MLADYYEPFILQDWSEIDDGFSGTVWKWIDGVEINGVYIQSSSNLVNIAQAQGFSSGGTFAADITAPVYEGSIVRRVSDNIYFKITGIPKYAPAQAVSQFKQMSAERTELTE